MGQNMLKAVFTCMLFLILAISPAISLAQDMPTGKWWRYPRMAEKLNLSGKEIRGLNEQFLETRRKLIGLKSRVERERFELENLLENETLNEAAVMDQFKRVEKERVNLATERFLFLIQVRKILGFERFQKLKTVYEISRRQKIRRNMERSGPTP